MGDTGLSAAVVAHSYQRIADQTINAALAQCDIGIYVGRDVSHVTIDSVTVTGAKFQGILAEKTSYLTVEHSTVTNNAWGTIDTSLPEPNPIPPGYVQSQVSQAFAISLFGVSHSTVAGNTVYNNGRGGIGVMDNGPNDPGAITQNTSAPLVSSSYDSVVGNRTWANYSGCGIVEATQNGGGSLSHLLIAGNRITGTGLSANGPDVGGIVVAADAPFSTVSDVLVRHNSVTGSGEGGILVNAETNGSSTNNVHVIGNFASDNNQFFLSSPADTVGIIVFAAPFSANGPAGPAAANNNTVVAGNTLTDQFYGIWSSGTNQPTVFRNRIKVTSGGTPIEFAA